MTTNNWYAMNTTTGITTTITGISATPLWAFPTYPPNPATRLTSPLNVVSEKKKEKQLEFVVGDGKGTSFTFQITTKYPEVRVFDRAVEGEDEEKTVTLKPSNATISIVSGETVTITFINPPARRGAVVLIK